MVIVKVHGKSDKHIIDVNPKWITNLHIWGEADVVIVGKDGVTGDQGMTMMFIGCAELERLVS